MNQIPKLPRFLNYIETTYMYTEKFTTLVRPYMFMLNLITMCLFWTLREKIILIEYEWHLGN